MRVKRGRGANGERRMDITNIARAGHWFQVLQTSLRAQTAMMTLQPGGASGPEPEAHPESDQVLLVLEGEAVAEIGGENARMSLGDVVIIPAGTKHRFSNEGRVPLVTFSVYSPPAYPPDARD